jgi:Tfp pilus assembly protein PilF
MSNNQHAKVPDQEPPAGEFVKFSLANSKGLFFAALIFAALVCVALTAAASKTDRRQQCHAAQPDSSIAACGEIIARGKREEKRDRIVADINRASAYRVKGELDLAIADLGKALQLNPKLPRALAERAEIYSAKAISTAQLPIALVPAFAGA